MGLSSDLHIFRPDLRPVSWSSKWHLLSHAWKKSIIAYWCIPCTTFEQCHLTVHGRTPLKALIDMTTQSVSRCLMFPAPVYVGLQDTSLKFTWRLGEPWGVWGHNWFLTQQVVQLIAVLLSKTGCLNNRGSIFDITGHRSRSLSSLC